MEYKDYYKTLGVDKKASQKEIKKAYRRLARKYHPDVNPGDQAAEARFKEINEAHEVLSDPEKRQKYDQFGALGFLFQHFYFFYKMLGLPRNIVSLFFQFFFKTNVQVADYQKIIHYKSWAGFNIFYH